MVHLNIIIQHRHQSANIFINGASTILNNVFKDIFCEIELEVHVAIAYDSYTETTWLL